MSNLRDAIVRMALRRPYLYLLVTLVISIVLMEVLVEIAEHTFIKPALQQLELQFIAYVQQFVTPPLTAEVMLVTASGSSTFYLLASALVCCWYLYSRQKDRLYLYLVCLCGGGILNQVLKRIFERVRPDIFPVIAESGYSFPSGHAMGAICFYGILAYFAGLGLRSKPLRWGGSRHLYPAYRPEPCLSGGALSDGYFSRLCSWSDLVIFLYYAASYF